MVRCCCRYPCCLVPCCFQCADHTGLPKTSLAPLSACPDLNLLRAFIGLHAVHAVRRVYHSVEPPSYQLGDIRSPPLAVFYGGRDRLADAADVATLLAALPAGAVVYSQVCLHWCWKCVLQAGVSRHAGCGMRLPLRLVGLAGAVVSAQEQCEAAVGGLG